MNQNKDYKDDNKIFNNEYPTIALLTEDLDGDYQAGVWPGILETVKNKNVNLVCFCGGSLDIASQDIWYAQGNVLYDIAEMSNVDGVIIAASLVSYITDEEKIKLFFNRFNKFPIVTLSPNKVDIPAVYVDNRNGMKEMMLHLVVEHEYQTYAMIGGPEGNIEAEIRREIFEEVLRDYGIIVTENMIIEGDFTREKGADAIRRIFDTDEMPDVVVAVDDETALGAMEACIELGINVPEDMALVGFDDIEESRYVSPTLTTVKQPLYNLGKTAVELLLKKISGEDVPQNTLLEAKMTIRQSCGCFPYLVTQPKESLDAKENLDTDQLIEHILKKVNHSYFESTKAMIVAFCHDINTRSSNKFLVAVDQIGRELSFKGIGLFVWHAVFDELRRFSAQMLTIDVYNFVDELLDNARIIHGELRVRHQGIARIYAKQEYHSLHEIGETLQNTLDHKLLMDVLCEQIPDADIETFYLVLYESKRMPSRKSRLHVAYVNDKRVDIGAKGILFETRKLLPANLITSNEVQVLVAEPLYFQDEQYGYVLFEATQQEHKIYDILREYICGALHSVLLLQKTKDQAKILAKANTELEKLREKEHAYLEAIKSELELGRKIQLGFLPEKLPQKNGWEAEVEFLPAREVSGDFYDMYVLDDDAMVFLIADVSGKDVSAALFMALIRTLLRVFSERAYQDGTDPLEAIEVVNDYIIQHHRQSDGRCMFATIFIAILNHETGECCYVNAGHNPPYILRNKSIVKKLPPTGPAVGLAGEMKFAKEKIVIEKGDMLFAFTDGVTEAQTPEGNFFGTKKLEELLVSDCSTAKETVAQIKVALKEHGRDATPFDDVTILAIKRN